MTGDDVADLLVSRRRLLAVVLILATLLVGSAAADVESSSSTGDFEANSPEARSLAYVEENFAVAGRNTTTVQVVVRGDNVLTRESLVRSLRFQRSLRENGTIDRTLAGERPIRGVANVVALTAIREAAAGTEGPPNTTLAAQIEQLESMDDDEVAAVVRTVLAPGADGERNRALALLPTDYEPGTASADARVILVTQSVGPDTDPNDPPDRIVDSQLAIQETLDAAYGDDAFAFGVGIVSDESARSIGDSFAIIGPVALLLVFVTLVVAYRDPVDIVLGMLGVALVLVWTFGAMGWLGIEFNTILIAVPILLIGLAIDYSIHVFMRYREARTGSDRSVADAMRAGLAGVGVALLWVTATTALGFLSNVASPLPPLQDFGLVSAIGIVSALIVFGGLIPALKVEVDTVLTALGFARNRVPFGGGAGPFGRLLALGTRAASAAPVWIVAVALLLAVGGTYGATQVDTSFDRADFLTEEPPAWTESLPGPLQPGEYSVRENADYLDDRFLQERRTTQAEILIRGTVTDPDTLQRAAAVRDRAADADVTVTLSDGSPAITGPVSTVRTVAARNETFAAVVDRADTDGDGVPDRNLTAVYDALYRADPGAAERVVAREDGTYVALRTTVTARGDATVDEVRSELSGAAAPADGDGLAATLTGQPVLTAVVQDRLLESVILTLVLTTVAVLATLTVGYRVLSGSASLGAVTIVPVLLALAWILGSMWLLDIAFNAQTATIASLGIGLGVDYSVHVSERFKHELDRIGDVADALERTIRGTGGALFASAITTASGFSTLALAINPSLQTFGVVIALAIVYAFLAAVFVLPSVLALWARVTDPTGVEESAATPSDPARP